MDLVAQLKNVREFYNTGSTKKQAFRKQQLLNLKSILLKYEKEVYAALYQDLKKSPEEFWVTEIGIVLSEINHVLNNFDKWSSPQKVKTNLLNFPSSSFILNEPMGVVLIISPWNYPLQLLLKPAIGAIAAGNCVVLKSSEYAPATTKLIKQMMNECFDKNYILFTEGEGALVVPEMMNQFCFDYVFFTGSPIVGKLVYQMAASQLVPVTLELGGKSPCVIEADADLKVAAKRVAVTKFSNAGQICVAPDYLLVHHSVKEKFIDILKSTLSQFFTDNAEKMDHYGKVINHRQFDRITQYLKDGKVIYGGRNNRENLFIEPTLMVDIDLNSAIMNEEIFGPILPIISFHVQDEAIKIIEKHKNPLAFYVFTSSEENEKKWLENIAFGGGCINNACWHLTNPHLPFGGRGSSGIGQYQGKYSFDTFSHKKSILKTPTWFDPSFKYPPFKGKLSLFKKFIR
jgi:aldehyde dehydrogenase (NAD+)